MILTQPKADLGAAVSIDLVSPTEEEVQRVHQATGLRVPTESEISEIESTSRLAFEDGAYYVSSPLVAPLGDHEHTLVPVGFVLSARVLLTVRFAALPSFDAAHAACVAKEMKSAEEAFLRILEVVVDRSADGLERAGTECDELSRSAFRSSARERLSTGVREVLRRIGSVADKTSRLRDGLLGVGRIAAYVTESGIEGAPQVNAARVKAIRADVSSLTDYEAHLAGKVQFLLDATLGFINIEQNEIVKTLTIASVVGIPPVLVAGIYGMNFRVMPELTWSFGYPMALGLIVVSGVLPLVWFKRRGSMSRGIWGRGSRGRDRAKRAKFDGVNRQVGFVTSVLFLVAAFSPRLATATDPDQVEWSPDWPRLRLWEDIGAVALTLGDTQFENLVPLPSKASWQGGILFDDWARRVFRGQTLAVQSTASNASDLMFKAGALVPFVMDDFFGALSFQQNVDVAIQLSVIDLESFGFAGLASLAAEHGVGRARPYTMDCNANGLVLDPHGHVLQVCGTGNDYRSFYSGHATATATAAGLVCVHHQHLPLFGGGFSDLLPCLAMIGVSATTGVLRLVYDEHWASDVIVGWADGFLSGYVLPSVLHFGFRDGHAPGEVRSGELDMAPTLLPCQGGSELGMVGVF